MPDVTSSRSFTSIRCIGGAMIDRTYRLLLPGALATSNPADVTLGFGGVARNVAANLSRLGMKTSLAAAIGDDAAGTALLKDLREHNVDVRRCIRMKGSPTSEYAAVLQPDGNLAFGIVAAGEAERALDAGIGRMMTRLTPGEAIFADCNLPAAALAEVIGFARGTGRFLAIDAVSVNKVERVKQVGDLLGISLLILNRDEAIALCGLPLMSTRNMARHLRNLGARMVVITRGSDHAIGADDTDVFDQPAVPAKAVDVSGAGDCLTATLLWRLSVGDDLRQALRWGMAAAAATVETRGSTNPALSPDYLAAALSRIGTA
jgi:pseudouridine kinase